MPQVSKRKLAKDIDEQIATLLLQAIAKLHKESDISSFLDELLTPTEKIMLSKRLAIAVLLKKGYNYTMIGSALKVTSTTIARVSYWINHKGTAMHKMVISLLNDARWEAFWNMVDYTLEKMMVPKKGSNWSMRRQQVERKHRKNASLF